MHATAGVNKKQKRGRKAVLSSKQRRRQEKGLDRAESIMERTVLKIHKSKTQSRKIQTRSKAWDEINKPLHGERPKHQSSNAQRDAEQEAVDAIYADTDEEMDVAENSEVSGESMSREVPPAPIVMPNMVPLPAGDEDEDEIL